MTTAELLAEAERARDVIADLERQFETLNDAHASFEEMEPVERELMRWTDELDMLAQEIEYRENWE